jgi:hypothetical protein
LKGTKNGTKGKSLSSLAAGLSAGGRSAPVPSPRSPLVAALARKGAITAGLRAKTSQARPIPSGKARGGQALAFRSPPPSSLQKAEARSSAPKGAGRSVVAQGAKSVVARLVVTPLPKPLGVRSTVMPAGKFSGGRVIAKPTTLAAQPMMTTAAKPVSARSNGTPEKPVAARPVMTTGVSVRSAVTPEKPVAARPMMAPAAKPIPARAIAAEHRLARSQVTPGSLPHSHPGPSSGIPPGLAGTSRSAASVAPLVKSANDSRAAPTKPGLGTVEHRRQYPRAELQVKARLSLADDPSHHFEASLPTSNVSVGGLFLSSTFFLKLSTRLEVRLSLPPHGREVHVKAQVVRVDPKDEKSPGFALRFTDYLDGSEVVLATHFLSPVLRDFISQYAKGNGFKPTPEYLSHTADVLAAWELRRAALGGDVWVVPGEN